MLSPNERARISARSGLADETIRRIERGKRVQPASRMRFDRAVAEEGLSPSVTAAKPSALPFTPTEESAAE